MPRMWVMVCVIAGGLVASVASSEGQQVTGGEAHSFVVDATGQAWMAGSNGSGRLGDGTTTARRTRVALTSLSSLVAVGAGASHTVALKADGTVWAWGGNGSGQVGDGTTTTRLSPTALSLSGVTAISVNGGDFSLARKIDGTVWAWGINSYGQLGDGTTTTRTSPTQVSGLSDVVAVSAGWDHALAVKSDGTVWAWGMNLYGQLGDNTTVAKATPVQVPGLSGVVSIAVGRYHSLAVTSSGTVWSWGYNLSGQLGDGTQTTRRSPVAVSTAPATSVRVHAGALFSVVATSTGEVWTWGENESGQLGDGSTTDRKLPGVVTTLSTIAAVAAGADFVLAIASDDSVWAWGRNTNSQFGDGATENRLLPVATSAGNYDWRVATPTFSPPSATMTTPPSITIATLTAGATLHYTTDGTVPTETSPVYSSPVTVPLTQTLRARAVKAGMPDSAIGEATYTLRVATPAIAPGTGTYGVAQSIALSVSTGGAELRYTIDGTDPTELSTLYTTPASISLPTTLRVRAFKEGWSPSTAASATYSFNYGTLSAPTASLSPGSYVGTQDVTLGGPSSAQIRYTVNGSEPTASSALYTGVVAVDRSMTLKAKAFQAGWVSSSTWVGVYTIKVPTPVLSASSGAYAPGTVVSITSDPTAGVRYTLTGSEPALTDPLLPMSGTLTIGEYTLRVRAFKVGCDMSDVATASYTLTEDMTRPDLAGGTASSLLLRRDGTVMGWGRNTHGRLGDGTTTQRLHPAPSVTLTGVVGIATGDAHILAVLYDRTVVAVGFNGYGRLGDGTTTTQTIPVAVTGLTDVRQVAAGEAHSLALRNNGTVWAWGSNASGQLGDGSTSSRSEATQVPGLTDIVRVAAGTSHSLAVRADGQVWAWGANNSRQLGDGTTVATRLSPVLVSNLAAVVDVAAGGGHSLALLSDGTLKAWGSNNSGQLGDGSNVTRSAPVAVTSLSGVARITAGTAFSMALGADGRVWSWGSNASGQLGAPAVVPGRSAPGEVVGLTGIAALSAGTGHGLAVSTDGTVWAWGDNGWGQVGDGTTLKVTSPVALSEPAFAWLTPTPTLSLASGTYSSTRSVTVGNALSTATLRYTLDGTDPDETSTPIAVNSAVPIDVSRTLKVRAWAPNQPPSHIASGVYLLQPGQPTFSPAGGSYATLQTVTVSSVPEAIVRWTLDGSDPLPTSTAYASPIGITTSSTLKAAAFRDGWERGAIRSAIYSYNFGTTASPGAMPAAGTYETQQSVTLSAEPGTTIRYTLDSSQPTASSPIYIGPVMISRSRTLKARAFKPDWTPGPVLTASYVITDSPPEITVRVRPEPNGAGWHRSDVTVNFECQDDHGVASCSSPVTVTAEGSGQIVTGDVVDSRGQTATVSVSLNIDKTSPVLTLLTPASGSSTPDTQAAFVVSADDVLSGVASATCGDVAGTVAGGDITCSVALAKGRNLVVIAATDAAGNQQAVSSFITRTGASTALTLSPANLTLVLDEKHPIQILDDFGGAVASPVWSVTNPLVAEVLTIDGMTFVHALAEGTATLSASANGLESTPLLLVVSAATSLADGSLKWRSPLSLIDKDTWLVPAAGDGADWYAVTRSTGEAPFVVQALGADGAAQWGATVLRAASGDSPHVIASLAGGVMLADTKGITQVGRVTGWRYDTSGNLLTVEPAGSGTTVPVVAQSPDGTTYVVEHASDVSLLALDALTGQPKWRVPLPKWHWRRDNYDCELDRNVETESPPYVGSPAVDSSGNVWLQVQHGRHYFDYEPCGQGGTLLEDSSNLALLRVTPAGTPTWFDLFSRTTGDGQEGDGSPGASMPLDGGGVLAAWRRGDQARLSRVEDGQGFRSGVTTTDIAGSWGSPLVASEGGQAYAMLLLPSDGSHLFAFDTATASVVWHQPSDDTLYAGTGGGGVATVGPTGLSRIDASGQVSGVFPVSGVRSSRGLWLNANGAVEAMTGPVFELASTGWAEPHGNSGQNAVACVVPVHYPEPLTAPIRFHLGLGLLAPDEDVLFRDAVKVWERIVQKYRPAVTMTVVRALDEGVGELYSVWVDPTLLDIAGRASRELHWIRFNPVYYNHTTYEYKRWLMLHEVGHIVGIGDNDCLRIQSVTARRYYGASVIEHAAAPTAADLAAVRLIYGTP